VTTPFTVAVVNDDAALKRTLLHSAACRHAGLRVSTYSAAEAAMADARLGRSDFILIDLEMRRGAALGMGRQTDRLPPGNRGDDGERSFEEGVWQWAALFAFNRSNSFNQRQEKHGSAVLIGLDRSSLGMFTIRVQRLGRFKK